MKVQLRVFIAAVCGMARFWRKRGQVETVVERLDPGVFEVEFTDNEGRAFAGLALKENQLLVL